jgi:hypothetical protein
LRPTRPTRHVRLYRSGEPLNRGKFPGAFAQNVLQQLLSRANETLTALHCPRFRSCGLSGRLIVEIAATAWKPAVAMNLGLTPRDSLLALKVPCEVASGFLL